MEEAKVDAWQHALNFFSLKSDKDVIVSSKITPETSCSAGTSAATKPKARLDTASGYCPEDEFSMKLSRINGAINKMTKEQLQEKLTSVGLNTCGVKDVLKKRLKNYYKRQKSAQCNRALAEDEIIKFDYLVVIDFEATCSETNLNFVHEIIEFPAVLIDTRRHILTDTFQKFCKPVKNPKLTDFCTNLTGITQSQVDSAQYFPEVLTEFEDWMASHKLGTEHDYAVLTDGPWDMSRFLKTQTELCDIPLPLWGRKWINLRKAYSAFYGSGKVNLQHMLQELGMTFQGRPHSGLDDSRNIAAIAVRLLMDGCVMRINEYQREEKPRDAGKARIPSGQVHQSPPKSRHTQRRSHSGSSARTSRSKEVLDIPQEGENLEDLLHYLKLQNS